MFQLSTAERQRLDYEKNLSKMKEEVNSLQLALVDAQAKIQEVETLNLQLDR